MEKKNLFLAIIIIGLIIICYGGYKLESNQDKKFNSSESKQSIFGGRDDLGNMLETQTENLSRESNRKDANNILIIGSIITIIGISLRFSVKSENNKTISQITQKDTIFCSECGKEHSSELSGKFCNKCGNKL